MSRWTARALTGSLALVVLLSATAGPPTVPAAGRFATAVPPALVLCVDDTTPAAVESAVRAAVTELDTLDEVSATYHRGVGCTQNTATHVVRVRQATMPPKTAAYTTSVTVTVNRTGRFTTFDAHARYLVVLHELMHVVLGHQTGRDWDERSGHVHRCDSILADSSACILTQTGLTPYDRSQVAHRYG